MFKLGFSTLGCPEYSVDQVIELATRNGFQGVELRFLDGTVDLTSLPELAPARIAETRRRFEDSGIEVFGINTSIRFTSPDPEQRAAQRESARVHARIAEGLGARYLRVFGGPIPQSQDREETTKWIAEGLSAAARDTLRNGVTTLLETHDSFCTARRITELFSYGVDDGLGVLWDVLHSHRHGETPEETYRVLGGRIKNVQVRDSGRYSPTNFNCVLTGAGTVPIPECLAVLRQGGYDGFVSFEWEKAWHPEIEEPEVAIPQFARYMAEVG